MKRVRRDERGSSLIIALVFLMLFSLWLTSTLASAETGLHISQTARVEPAKMYGADAAIEEAIQKIRYGGASSPPKGAEGAASCDTTAQVNGLTYYVECTPQTGSGQAALTGSSPDWGVVALSTGQGGESGIQKGKNGLFKIDGGLFSNYGLAVDNGSLCPGTNCNQLNLCPNNTKTVTDAIFVGSGGSGNTPTKTVTSFSANFQLSPADPGKNDVGVGIRGSSIAGGATIAAVAGPSSITMSATAPRVGSNQTVTFRDDYAQKNSWCNPEYPASAWPKVTPPAGKSLSHGTLRVLGGYGTTCNPLNQSQTVAVSFQCPPDISRGDLLAVPNPGDPDYPPDQTAFGPPAASPTCTDVWPGMYGAADLAALNNLTTGNACNDRLIWFHPGVYYFDFTGASQPVWNFSNSSSWVVAGAKKWTTRPNGVDVLKGTVSVTTAKKNGVDVTTYTLDTGSANAFSSTDEGKWVVPGTGVIRPAKILKVVANSNGSKVTLDRGAAWSGMFVVTDGGAASDAACDKAPSAEREGVEFIFGGPSQMNVSNMKVEMCAAAVPGRQQISIYGAKNTTDSLVSQNGCVTATPYLLQPGAPGCAFLSTTSDLMVHGTVYAPLGAVFLSVKNDHQIGSRGLIARAVGLDMYPNASTTDPVIFSPDYGTVEGADRRMLMTACLGSSCTATNKKLTAMVCIKDNTDDTVPCYATATQAEAVPELGHKVAIESWTFVR